MHHNDTPTTEYASPAQLAQPAAPAPADVPAQPPAHTSKRIRRSSAFHSQRRRLRRAHRAALAVLPYLLFLTGLALASLGVLSYLEHESPLALFITSRDAVHASATPGQPSLDQLGQAANDTANDPANDAADPATTNADWPVLSRDTSGRLIVPFFYIGDPFGTITIPSVDIEVTAYHGDSETEFRKGVGHYAGSFYPGQDGNILIAGHRNSFFRNFEYLAIGDTVNFDTTYGHFEYTITEFKIIQGSDNSIAKDTTQEQLTMYTCYPFTYIGNAPERYVVIAELTTAEVNVA